MRVESARERVAFIRDWGLGMGGLGIGDWGLGINIVIYLEI